VGKKARKGAGKFLQRGQKNGKNEDHTQHKQGYYLHKQGGWGVTQPVDG